MSLPTLQTPTYSVELPSSGKIIEFRPFLVKEEKALMVAQEEGSQQTIIKTIIAMLKACTFEKVEVETLPIIDLEKIFVSIRTKSVGSKIEVTQKCKNDECDHKHETIIDLDEIQLIATERPSNKVMLTDKVGVTLRDLRVSDIMSAKNNDTFVESIMASIETVFDQNEVHESSATNRNELKAFVESMTSAQRESITKYIHSAPKLVHKSEFTCPKCSLHNEHEVEGISNFFG